MPELSPARPLSPALPGTRLSFVTRTLLLPAVLVLAASWLLMEAGGDQWFADQIYRWQGSHWVLKDAWWSSHLIHKGGRNLSFFAAALVILALIRTYVYAPWKPLRKPLAYLLSSVALSSGLVSLLKTLTRMDCPWDLERYGGLHPFIGLFEARPVSLGHAACFPAGHASAGYAWLAVYFFMLQVRPQWRWPAVSIVLLIGIVFGITQQLRGAHFLSHDLWSLAISWTVAVGLYLAFFTRASQTQMEPSMNHQREAA